MEPKKPRGRPKGTVIPTDRKVLEAVADLFLQQPALRPTTAIKRVVQDWTGSVVHRLMGKWRKERVVLIAEARQRQEAAQARRSSAEYFPVHSSVTDSPARIRRASDILASTLHNQLNSPNIKTVREFNDSPAMRAIRDIQNNPAIRMMQAMQINPITKMMKEQDLLRRRLGLYGLR